MGNGCHDLLMVLVGGIIGLFSSLIILSIQHWINHKGKTKIYYKFLGLPIQNIDSPGWGCTEQEEWVALWVPMAVELINTSNCTRVVRDLSLHLYNDAEYVARMVQIEYTQGRDSAEYGTDNNAYSFTLMPRSVQKQKCLFCYKILKEQKQSILFDTMKMRYYDEKDHLHEASINTGITDCWKQHVHEAGRDWALLERKN